MTDIWESVLFNTLTRTNYINSVIS